MLLAKPRHIPLQALLQDPLLEKAGVRVSVKREDLIHPYISGNKWRKLRYAIEDACQKGATKLLTFGGAYSNHILATAAAAHQFGFESVGIIRGEEHTPRNPTLAKAQSLGMELRYINRTDYRKKYEAAVQDFLRSSLGDFYMIPEGGSSNLGILGCEEIISDLSEIDYDYIALSCGTGGTMAGIITALEGQKEVLGFPALKGGDFLKEDIQLLVYGRRKTSYSNWKLITDYHFGGYAKKKPELLTFMQAFGLKHEIPLEFVYTGKMFFGLYDLIQKNYFPKGSHIVAIHTGGLQNGLIPLQG